MIERPSSQVTDFTTKQTFTCSRQKNQKILTDRRNYLQKSYSVGQVTI